MREGRENEMLKWENRNIKGGRCRGERGEGEEARMEATRIKVILSLTQ